MAQLTLTIPCPGCCGPPVTCHDALGDTLHAALSGVNPCGGCYTVELTTGGPSRDMDFMFTGINGTFDLTWNGVNLWQNPNVGTITVNVYNSANGTCTGLDTTLTGDAQAAALCDGDNHMSVGIGVTLKFTDSGGHDFNINFAAYGGSGTFGAAMPSTITGGDCGNQGNGNANVTSDGTMTLSI